MKDTSNEDIGLSPDDIRPRSINSNNSNTNGTEGTNDSHRSNRNNNMSLLRFNLPKPLSRKNIVEDSAFKSKCYSTISKSVFSKSTAEASTTVAKVDITPSTAAYAADKLFLEMCNGPLIEHTCTTCRHFKIDHIKRNYYYLEAAKYAGRISAGKFDDKTTEKPIFTIILVHFSPELQKALLEYKGSSLHRIVTDAVFRIFRARHEMIFYQYIEAKRLRWRIVQN